MATATLSYNLKTLIGDNFDPRRTRVWVTANVPLIVVDGTTVRLDNHPTQEPASDGTGSFSLVTTNSASNPTSFAYTFHVDYALKGRQGNREQWHSSEFTFTASANIAAISEAFDGLAIAPTWQSEFRAEMEAIAGLTGEDDAIANRINTVGSDTELALRDYVATKTRTYRPEDYGAAGDGSTVDSAAWQAMFNAIAADGVAARVDCRGDATYLLGDVHVDGISDVEVNGNGATIKTVPTAITRTTLLIGFTTANGRAAFDNLTFDDNGSARVAEERSMIGYVRWDRMTFRNCAFVDPMHHFIANYGAGSGERLIFIENCTFDGPGNISTASHIYCSGDQIGWRIRGCAFSNIGTSDTEADQAVYCSGSKSFVLSDCTFDNCGQSLDFRASAHGVAVSNITISGGSLGKNAPGVAELRCYYTEDAVIQNVIIMNSHKPVVVRLEAGSRNVLRDITYRYGTDSPLGQRAFRIGGTGHRIIDPDFRLPAASGNTAAIELHDQPTDVEVIGGVFDGGDRLFYFNPEQATTAANFRNVSTRGHTALWVRSDTNASGVTPPAVVAWFGGQPWWEYTPALGGFTGTVELARFTVTGGTIRVQVTILISAVTGTMTVNLPTGPQLSSHPAATAFAAGVAVATDASPAGQTGGAVAIVSSQARALFGTSWANATAPFTWAAGDRISLNFEYERG